MKKLKLNLQQMGRVEVLTREQLRKVLGGDTGSGGTDPCAGKASSIYCRDANRNILHGIDGTGCPTTGAGIDTACSSYAGYVRSASSCAC